MSRTNEEAWANLDPRKEKVVTRDVNVKGWLVQPGHSMFQLRNKSVSMTVQPTVQNFGICSVKDPDDIPENFVELKEENARLILLSIKDSIEKALAGEEFELKIEPWPREEKVITKEVAENYLREGAQYAEENDLEPSAVELYMGEFTDIDAGGAEVLCKHEGELSLSGITCLADEAARYFRNHKGVNLNFSQLETLSDFAAECLSNFDGTLYFDSLSELTDTAAESLSKHKGDLNIDLDNLPASAAKILRDAGHG